MNVKGLLTQCLSVPNTKGLWQIDVDLHTAVKTGSVKHGMASQAWHDLHLVDNRLSLVNVARRAPSFAQERHIHGKTSK